MSSVLFSRIAGFGGLVKIKTPEDVKEEYREFVTKAYNTLERNRKTVIYPGNRSKE